MTVGADARTVEAASGVDVVTVGETMVALRSAGPLTVPGALTARLAGAESTVAIGLARLGHRVRWVSRVGDDEYGSVLVRALRGEGVDVSGVEVDPTRPTGLMLASARTADITSVTYYRAGSAASALGPDDAARLGPAGILHVTGITPALGASAAEAVRVAVGSGSYSMVSLDVNHRSRLWSRERAAEVLRPLLPHLSIVIGSPDELLLLADGGVPELVGRGLEVVEKRGPDGAALWPAGGPVGAVEVPAVPVTVVDVVGAGDAFTAGYLSGILDGLAPLDRLRRAVQVAAFCVSTPGDYEGLPTRSELDRLQLVEGTTLR
jgi:2-dehydro-3-deoxygluconokinase